MRTRLFGIALSLLLLAGEVRAQGVVGPGVVYPYAGGGGGGSSTLTAGTTETSGCTDGGFLYSLTSLLRCGANAINDGSVITLGGVAGSGDNVVITNGTSTRSILLLKDNATTVLTVADGGATTFAAGATFSSTASVAGGFAVSGANGFSLDADSPALFLAGGGAASGVFYSRIAVQTPDVPAYTTGTTSGSFHFFEYADRGFDFNNGACSTSACTDPSLILHSATQDTTQYNHMAAWGTAGGAAKTLTESAATAVIRIPVAQGAATGGVLTYTIVALDATDQQAREGEIKFAVVNKAGAETCTISAASELLDGSVVAVSAGTLTYAITCASNAADTVDIEFNAVSSLTQTTLQARYTVKLVGPGQPARQ